MPQAALAVAVWVGSTVAFAATAVGASTAVAAAVGYATIGVTLAAEVYAVNAAVSAVTPKIKDPGQVLQWQADPRAGVPYPMGRTAASGKIIFNQSAPASSRKFLNFVTVYSGVPADAFEAFQANGVTVNFTADSGEGASGYYLNRMWLKSQLGHEPANWLHWTATGSKDTPANHGGMPTEWTPQHLTTGYPATLWALEYDTARYASGVPSPRMIGRWAKTYDPRQDSTYPGGSGLHRWNDENTWTWSPCPYRNGLSWAIGRRNNGQLILGLGYELDEIDVASFVHGMNVSDVNGWSMGGQVDSDDDPWEALKAILQAGAGYPILGGTQLSVMVNAPAVSVATINEGDVVGAITVPAQVSANDRINTVWPSYTEEALDWQVVTPDAPVQVPEYVALDGEERSIPLGMPLVQDATQVGQLSRYAIEDARELNGIVLACKPWAQWIAPGLCVTANVPSAGLNGQKLRVLNRSRDPASMVVTFISRTETDGKHPYALGQTNTPPDTPTLTGGNHGLVQLPGENAWEVNGGSLAGPDGALPAIVISGQADLHDAVTIVVDYREVFNTEPVTYGEWRSESFPAQTAEGKTKTLVVTGVTPGARYQVRIRYITARGVENPDANTDLGQVIVGGIVATHTEKLGDKTAAEWVDEFDQSAAAAAQALLIGANWRAYTEAMLYLEGTPISNVVLNSKEQVNGFAQVLELIGARNGDNSAFILDVDTVKVDQGEAMGASRYVSLTGVVNNHTSEISQIFESAGGYAKAALLLNVDGHVAGWELMNNGGIGSFVVVSDIFGFIDPNGGSPIMPFAYEDGLLSMLDVAVNTLKANVVQTQHIVAQNVVVPVTSVGSSQINCDNTNKLIISHTVNLAFGANVISNCCLSSHFPSGNKPWMARMYINGEERYSTGGANGEASMNLAGALYCEPGPVLIEVRVQSDPTVNITSRALNTFGPMR